MSRKRKALPLIEGLVISDVAAEGNALGRTPDDMVVFVPFAAPGDVVDVQIEKKRSSYAIGRVERLVAAGDVRVEPRFSFAAAAAGSICPTIFSCNASSARSRTRWSA